MFKKLLTAASIVTIALFLLPACAKQGNEAETTADSAQTEDAPVSKRVHREKQAAEGSVMNQPVNFSSQSAVNKSIEKVRQEVGDAEADELNKAMGVILTQDMSMRQDKEILFRKLNGKTPNEIIAMMKL